MRSPANPYAFEKVRNTTRFGCSRSSPGISRCSSGSTNSIYASSRTTTLVGGAWRTNS
ncbi:Uncharacterised protein [Mycobacteroides abscessus subsp. abscessus]|nr:Uncharacterised protein [Mycobacteroides abscessus subsp. abscessus]